MAQSLNRLTDQFLKPWYAVATPHEDIREGRLAEASLQPTSGPSFRGQLPRSTSTRRSSSARRTRWSPFTIWQRPEEELSR